MATNMLGYVEFLEPRPRLCGRIGEVDHDAERSDLPHVPADELCIAVT
jgi:hypothetical protein